ncbi:MAG: penicillin-binding protein [Candidatus Melainabacteria bacterium HGW-Melainabacteria-1]|nr:MAG: penicillin-binding protein [Candidatus Melainabacteria bacterium HGW-Melainabacteria-1]
MLVLLLAGGAIGGAYVALQQNFVKLSDVSSLERYAPIEATEIFDIHGKLLYKLYGEENRKVIKLDAVPDVVQKAIISAEDARFYEHKGVDPVGLGRALKINLDKGDALQGGSTITQQVVKNLFLTPERTFQRKLAEMWMAVEVEKRYSKSQILELYLNQIYWGHNAYGIEAAAQNYFGKPAAKLSLAEGALLAGILTGPELYSPYRNPKAAKHRQHLTLGRMAEVGFISQQEAAKAEAEPLKYPGIKAGSMRYPYFTSYVIAKLKENYGDSSSFKRGMRVYTTLNPEWQNHAEKALSEHVQRNRRANVSQAALIAIENQTGYVRAIVGGTSYKQSQFNRAWQAQRQPGSAFKPFVYLTAFARGFQPGHRMSDEPIQYRFGSYVWRPRNYGGGHSGVMTLQRALEFSSNIIAVKLGERVGNGNVIDTAHRIGIRSPMRNVLSLALGPNEVTPLEIASAYSTIARNGSYLEPTPILKIEDRFGNLIEDNRNRQAEPVYSDVACNTLAHAMKGVIERGTAAAARIGRPAAGKTGTTSDHKDAWFVGFTPQITTAVWIGNDKPTPMYGYATGGHLSAPLWANVMRHMHALLPRKDFVKIQLPPPVISAQPIDAPDVDSGFIPSYERLGARPDKNLTPVNDPFLLDPANLPEMPVDNTPLPMELPTAGRVPMVPPDSVLDPPSQGSRQPKQQQGLIQDPPPDTVPGVPDVEPTPSSPRKQQIINELDQLLEELDRMGSPPPQ